MDRLPITDLDCVLLDAVLLLSFDAGELANLSQPEGGEDACTCGRRALDAVHRACHAGGPLARRIERSLDLVHRRSLERLGTEGLRAFGGELLGPQLSTVADLGGALWAVLGAPAPEAHALRAHLRRALVIDGLHRIADLQATARA
jgi:hypothetical protein